MLNVLGKARRPVEALNIFHAMQVCDFEIITFSALFLYTHNFCLSSGLFYTFITCLSLNTYMFSSNISQKELSSYPDMAAYHCIAVTLGQAGYLKELFDVIDCMKTPPKKLNNASKLDPDAVVYNAVSYIFLHFSLF